MDINGLMDINGYITGDIHGDITGDISGDFMVINGYYWLVVWNMTGLWLSIILGISSFQLTNSDFSEG